MARQDREWKHKQNRMLALGVKTWEEYEAKMASINSEQQSTGNNDDQQNKGNQFGMFIPDSVIFCYSL